MADALKPCPFCGGSVIVFRQKVRGIGAWESIIKCTDGSCHVKPSTGWKKGDGAIAAWNTRKEQTNGA